MNVFEQSGKTRKRAQAAARAGQIRRQRLAQARERETRIEETVIDILAARLAIGEAEAQIADGVQRLKALGETQDSIAGLCELSTSEVRAALTREHASVKAPGVSTAPIGALNDEEA